MSSNAKCRECGTPVSDGGPGGLCRKCLLGLGLKQAEGSSEPAAEAFGASDDDDRVVARTEKRGDRIGHYKLIEQIGEGGMGCVWMAEQTEPVRRTVALKVIKPGMDSAEVLARFEAERQALALMDHPNIAKVLEAGTTPEGRPYFVMDLVKGIPFMRFCDEQRLSVRERLELFMQVCQAVQHAHQKGIIHRDLKPSNVLVALYDGKPVPKVIDFGVAKAMGQRLTDRTLHTRFGAMVGTLAYMSPEQSELNQLDIDTRSDIYSLGVLLYELLTGTTPLTRESLQKAAFDEVLRRIREEEPPKPSLRLSTSRERLPAISAQRKLEPAKLTKVIRGDLDWIVMKCLEKDRTRRYETANGLASDIQRHLGSEPVTARPPSNIYRFQKTVRRNKLAFAAAGAVLTSLLVGLGATTVMFFKEQAARHSANAASVQLQQKNTELERRNTEFRAMLADAARSDSLVAEDELRSGKEQEAFAHLARACEYDPSSLLAASKGFAALGDWSHELPNTILVGHTKNVQSAQFSPDGTRIVTASGDKTAYVWDVATGQILVRLAGHTGAVSSAEFSPDGARIVTGSYDDTARVWDPATGKTLATLTGHDKRVSNAHFSPDGMRIVTVSDDKTACVWDPRSGNALVTLVGHEAALLSAQFSPDSKRILTASEDKTARLWDAVTGTTLATFAGHTRRLWSARFNADGTRIVTASEDKTARVWDPQSGHALVTLAGHEGGVESAHFSPDGTRIVTAGMGDKTVRIWDTGTGELLKTLVGHKGYVHSAQFSPNGDCIVSASWTEADSTARVWDASTGKALAILAGHERVTSAHFSPDGKHIVTASSDCTARVWEVAARKTSTTFAGHEGPLLSAQFSADGTRILTKSDKTARLWDAVTGRILVKLDPPEGLRSARFSPNGTRILTTSLDKTARVWDAITGRMMATLDPLEGLLSAQFSPDATRIVTVSADKTARAWDAVTGKMLATFAGVSGSRFNPDPGGSAQFSPDGARIVTTSDDMTAQVHDAATGKVLATLAGDEGAVREAQFSPDGTRIVTVSGGKTARVWDTATGKLLATLVGHEGFHLRQFSPDGTRIVTVSSGRLGSSVLVWDTATGKMLVTLVGSGVFPQNVQFSPDGTRIIATSRDDTTARVWDVATGKLLATLAGHEANVLSAEFSPDGTRIVTASEDCTSRVWETATGKLLATLAGHAGAVYSAHFSPDSTRILTASEDKTARVWDVLPSSAGPPPKWFPDFLRCLAQMRLNSDAEFETLKTADWLALRERLRGVLRASASADTPYLRILRKYVRE